MIRLSERGREERNPGEKRGGNPSRGNRGGKRDSKVTGAGKVGGIIILLICKVKSTKEWKPLKKGRELE